MGTPSNAEICGLKAKSIRGGALNVAVVGINHFTTLLSVAVLARLLTPEDYGSVAMVTALIGFVNIFKDFGLSAATIQALNLTHAQHSALFWINAAFGALLTLATMSAAPLIAWFYGKPHLLWVTIGLAFGSLFSCLGTQHMALLTRQMRFRALAVIEVTALFASSFVSIGTALLHGGYWALVAGRIGTALWATAGAWIACNFRPDWFRRGTGVRRLVRFGANVAVFDIATYFRDNMDQILIGRVWGAQPLGLYEKAVSLLQLPMRTLRFPLNKVAFPALSRLADDPPHFRSYFVKYCSLLAFASMPIVAVLYGSAESIIGLLLGERWLAATDLFKILAVAGFIESVASLRPTVIMSTGHGKRLFRLGFCIAVATVGAVAIGVAWGAKGVALAYCLVTYIILHPSLLYAFRGTPVRPRDLYRAVARPCLASIVMLLTYLLLVEPLLPSSDVAKLSVALPFCACAYLGIYGLLPGGLSALGEYLSYLGILLQRVRLAPKPT